MEIREQSWRIRRARFQTRISSNVPQVGRQLQTARLIGRNNEMAELRAAFVAARSGVMNTVIIGGEAGVGKTRLAREFLQSDHGAPALVLSGNCRDSADSPLPFGAIVEAIRPLSNNLDEKTRTELFVPVREQLAGILPNLESNSISEAGSRSQLFEAILLLLERVTSTAPAILLIEDLHWADQSTRDFVAFLIDNARSAQLTLVITYRSDELVTGDVFLKYIAQLARNPSVSRINLERLERDDLLTYLDELAGRAVESTVGNLIWDRSLGNAFYAEQLLASHDDSDNHVPQSINDTLLARLNALGATTQRTLRVIAAGGEHVDHSLLTTVAGDLSAPEIDDAMREAVAHQILVDSGDGSLKFRHTLIAEVAYSQLLPQERRDVHRRYAVALSDAYDLPLSRAASAAELAHHYFAAGEKREALNASIDAAAETYAACGYAESRVHYEHALTLWSEVSPADRPAGVDYIELLDQCAAVAHLEGDNNRSVELMRDALTHTPDNDPRRRIIRVRLGTYLRMLGESQEALTEHEQIVREMSDEAPSSLHAEILCAYALSLTAAARHRESAKHAEEALLSSRTVGDRPHEARALSILGSNLVVLGQPDLGARYLNDALELAEELNRPADIAAGYHQLAMTLSGPLNKLDDALAIAKRGSAQVAEIGLERHWGAQLQSIAIDTLFRMGRWDEAVALLSVAIHRSAKGIAALDLLLARAKLTVGRGEFESAQHDLDTVATLAARAIDLRYTVPLATLRAGLALWQHDLTAATNAVDEGLEHIAGNDDVWFAAPLVWHGMRVEAERAEQARAALVSDTVESAIERGTALRSLSLEMCRSGRQQGALRLVVDAYDVMCEGELLRIKGEAAPDVWSVVASSWEQLGHPYPHAYANWRWAEALLARPNGVMRASQLLRNAYRVALDLRASPLQRELEALAKRARIDLAASAVAADEIKVVDIRESVLQRLRVEAGLTKREAQILSLVADGQSNRGIAETCFISEKTASVHVSNILMKLDVRSRVQAAALFHRAISSADN